MKTWRQFTVVLAIFTFGFTFIACDNGTTPEKDTVSRWVVITDFEGISTMGFSVTAQLGTTDESRADIATCLGYPALDVDFSEDPDAEITIPLVNYGPGFWHGNGSYYVYFGLHQPPLRRWWVSNEPILFSDDSPKPILSLKNAHLIYDDFSPSEP